VNCSSGKLRYKDRIGARMALLRIQGRRSRQHQRRDNEAGLYQCPECHGWHLTSQRKAKPQ
jgi:hypothetical protein